MSFCRGVSLPVAHTLGHAPNSTLGPTAGNGFYSQWPDDLALLVESGVGDIRLTFDWARLQPRPGQMAEDWGEFYESILTAAHAVGVDVWGCVHDGGVPRWLDDEGGLDDSDVMARWWPRWVERIADTFGDGVQGWIPFVERPSTFSDGAWGDTWGILRGEAPVVFPIGFDPQGAAAAGGRSDLIGLSIALRDVDAAGSDRDVDRPIGERLGPIGDRWADSIGRTIDLGDAEVIVSDALLSDDPDLAGASIERLIEVVDGFGRGDHDGLLGNADEPSGGGDVDLVLVGPAVSGPDADDGLFDRSRAPLPSGVAYLSGVEPPDPDDVDDADGESGDGD